MTLFSLRKPGQSGLEMPAPAYIASADAALELFADLRGETVEVAGFAFLDPEWRLLGLRHVRPGAVDSIQLPLRSLVADALALDAAAVVMAHNHPSGDPAPSAADHEATRRIARALAAVDIRLVEHLVIARNGATSFRAAGLL